MKSPESSSTQQPQQPAQEVISSDEAEAALKDIHMTGRAMRVDETPEQYKAEREASWLEKQKEQKIDNPQDQISEQEVQTSTERISDLGQVAVYDRSGKRIFSGDPDQLLTFWKNKDYGAVENIGSISDGEGATIMRFGPEDGRGFFSRQRIEGVFQKLGEEVATRKRSAEDTQKLRETRANLGVAEESLPAPKSAGQTETSRATERSESVQEENIFDDEKANQVVAVMKDWAKYGGKLYDHLTGKDPRLEEGVDWQRNSDGSVNRESYRVAVSKKAEAWLTDPGNQKWFDDFVKFHKEHTKEMSSEEKKVRIRNVDGTFSEKMKRTAPYLYQDGWLYHESNYFDEQKGEMTQPEREKTKYRAYINVGGEDLMQTFGDVIEALGNDPELKRLGFQIKTADARISETVPKDKYKPNGEMRPATEEEKRAEQAGMAMNVMNQRDRIVVYLGEKGIERAIPILRRYAEQNRAKFEKYGVLFSQTLKDSGGKEIPGISLTSETKGKSSDPSEVNSEYKSFSDMQDKVLQSSLRSLKAALRNPKTLEGMHANYPRVKERLARLKPNASQEDFVRAVVSDTEGEEFLVKQLKSIYPQWAKAFGMSGKNVAFKDGGEL